MRPEGLTWTEIDEDQMVVIILTASLLTRDLGRKTSTLILQDLIGYMGRRVTTSHTVERRPIHIVMDEIAQMAYPDMTAAYAMAGGAGARLIALWQSRAGVVRKMGSREGAQEIFDNTQTRVYLASADDETASRVSDAIGEAELITTMDTSRRDDESGFSDARALNRARQPLVSPPWLGALPPGHSWARIGGQYVKLAAPMLEPFDADTVERLGYAGLVETLRRHQEQVRREQAEKGEAFDELEGLENEAANDHHGFDPDEPVVGASAADS